MLRLIDCLTSFSKPIFYITNKLKEIVSNVRAHMFGLNDTF